MAAMAWNKVPLLMLFFFVFLHLGLVFGDSCRSYPADPAWKASLGEAERTAAQLRVMRSLRILSGAFTQGLRPLLTKSASDTAAEVQGVRMVVVNAELADSRDVFRVRVQLTLGFWERFFSPVQLPGGRGPAPRATQDATIAGEGTFHEGTGELCVPGCIGTVCKYKLKLGYPTPKTLRHVSTSGILSSTADESDATFFNPVSIHAMTDGPFQYTLNATVASECPKLAPDVSSGKLWREEKVCSQGWASHQLWTNQAFEVSWDCEGARCSPFEELGKNGSFSSLRFDRIRCDGDRLQGLMLFTDVLSPIDRYADPASTDGILVAEGTWDSSTGRMCMIACRLYGLEDCQIAVTVQFPLTFSVTQRSTVVGHIRSLRKETDAAYFKPVSFRQISSGLQVTRFTSTTSQPEYVYTKVDTAKTLCALGNKKTSPGKYPSGVDWRDLEFHGMKDKKSASTNSFVNLNLFTFRDQFRTYDQLHVTAANVTGLGAQGIMNVSYSIYYQIGASSESVMAGEGVYDPDTGSLCLIACQFATLKNAVNLEQGKDCQIFFNVQFPPTDSQEVLKGSVRSLRLPTDPLHFAREKFSGTVHLQAVEAVWRVDLEIVLSVVMLSLTVVFIILQLVYTKQYPETLPYISTSMLLLLSLAHMIPLVLNFEALFQKQKNDYQVIQRAAGWPEVNEVVVRLTTMTAMLLQLRLLQLVWKSRVKSRATGEIDPAVQERRVLYTILPIYFLGGVIAVLSHALFGFRPYERQFLWRGNEGGLWWDIKAYGGLLLDFHLFPQVVGNVLWGAKEQAPLCKTFYFGMAAVRSIPHLYDLCRKFKFIPAFADTYVYANPEWDFYSVTSDILIPLVTMLLALMVCVQQRWGGRCLLPRRWRSRFEYEKVDVAPI